MEFFQQLLTPIIDNFFKFDFLIILIAMGAWVLYLRCLASCKELSQILQPKGNMALGKQNQAQMNQHYERYFAPEDEDVLLTKRANSNSLYVGFTNVVAIFPLMGLLGTVISLIPMVGEMDTDLFFMALTSTFWGIVFAIVFKVFNGFLQATLRTVQDLRNEGQASLPTTISRERGINLFMMADSLEEFIELRQARDQF